jgi:hypothetical protein
MSREIKETAKHVTMELKWRRTSAKNTFELNGAEAVSLKFNGENGGKLVLYQVNIFNLQDNKGMMCKNCKVRLNIFVGTENCIYNHEKCSIPMGAFPRLKDAKEIAQNFEDKF